MKAARLILATALAGLVLGVAAPRAQESDGAASEAPVGDVPQAVEVETLAPDAGAPLLSSPATAEPVQTSRFRDTTLAAPPPVAADAPPGADLAYGAYQRGYYLTAFHRATQRLESAPDDAAAMTLLGELYAQGLGIPQDVARAADWYRLAAREGDPNALFALAMIEIEGATGEADPEAGRALLEQAAEAGHPRAAYNLALLLFGSEAEADLARAADLVRRAAEAEIPTAQHALGVLYAEGRGLEENPIAAAAWFARSARNGDVPGMVEYAIALFNGEGIATNEEEAARWFREAAFNGNAVAQNRLARLYATGRGVPEDPVEAAAWHLAASAQGLADPWLDEELERLGADEREHARSLAESRLAGP
ncbi:tetratricopeptide repeat protein [Salinarimonas ramus]|uniref:Sel1 repeat family protein n=1 Tax=Salinarimonas ramus TaxID=690164 RepID=A0A917V4J2_9HYPH|nr:tetratricopeptide repeat protein [Salinarimonas ramus]GGK38778.1 hypothetical protein GCM10011322_27320 [Salinarimonas ramus]